MANNAAKVRDEAMRLPAPDRARLAAELLGSLDDDEEIGEAEHEAAWSHEIAERLRAHGYRVDIGEPTETIGKRIRATELQKIPFVVVYGDRESEESLAIRERGGGQSQESLADFTARLATLDA